MTTELWILVGAALLQWVLIMSAATPNILYKGLGYAAGPRDEDGKPTPAWARRIQRSSDNMGENLVLFAILILVVHVSGSSSELSTQGAWVFLGARLLHPLLYIAGIPWARTAVWAVSIAGMGMVGAALL